MGSRSQSGQPLSPPPAQSKQLLLSRPESVTGDNDHSPLIIRIICQTWSASCPGGDQPETSRLSSSPSLDHRGGLQDGNVARCQGDKMTKWQVGKMARWLPDQQLAPFFWNHLFLPCGCPAPALVSLAATFSSEPSPVSKLFESWQDLRR